MPSTIEETTAWLESLLRRRRADSPGQGGLLSARDKSRLFDLMAQRRNMVLPANSLNRILSLEDLAAWIVGNADRIYDPLIRFEPAASAGGPRPNLVCVHPVSGFGTVFRKLAQGLKGHAKVYALQGRGLNPGETPLTDLKRMISLYAERICAELDGRPLHLLGWSFGGVVAPLLSLELARRGRPVSSLCAVDSHVSAEALSAERTPLPDFDGFVREKYCYLAPDRLPEFDAMTGEQRLRGLIQPLVEREAVSPGAARKLSYAMMVRMVQVGHCMDAMHRRHRPPHHAARTVLVQASDSEDWGEDCVGRWQAISPELSVERVAVPHLALMWRPESLAALTAIVRRRCLAGGDPTVVRTTGCRRPLTLAGQCP